MDVSELIGKTLVSITKGRYYDGLSFKTACGKNYVMKHSQECCESVILEDVCGEFDDLIGSPITTAEERIVEEDYRYGLAQSTFYELATNKGSVTLRWYGTSNGYYSVSVNFLEI